MEGLLLVIIIGILSAIFGKGKGNKQHRNNKPFSIKNFDEIRTQVQNEITHYTSNRIEKRTDQKNIEKTYRELKQEAEELKYHRSSPQKVTQHPRNKVTKKLTEQVEAEEVPFSEDSDAKTVINGIIWSEILGEPRSKKPYSPRKL